jgi:hypothetical protein
MPFKKASAPWAHSLSYTHRQISRLILLTVKPSFFAILLDTSIIARGLCNISILSSQPLISPKDLVGEICSSTHPNIIFNHNIFGVNFVTLFLFPRDLKS